METAPAARTQPLIIFGDDDPLAREMLATTLRDAGFEIEVADNGRAVLEKARQQRPDLLLLDWLMPELDGLEVCRRVRADPTLASIPVLILTSQSQPTALEQAFDAGATDFVTKPIAPAVLSHRIRFLLRATAAAEMVRRSESRLAEAQRIAQVGNWEWDPRTGAFLGSEEALRLLEARGDPLRTFDEVKQRIHPQERELFHGLMRGVAEGEENLDREFRVPRLEGGFRFVHLRGHPMFQSPGARRVLGTVQDVTERVQAEERIRTLAYYDSLTGLPNRILFVDQLRAAISNARRRGRKVGVMLLDLDNFKEINDTLGHDAGDAVLRQVSGRLREVVRGYDSLGRELSAGDGNTVGRMGGDEFMLAIVDLNLGEEAAVVAGRLLDALKRPVRVANGELVVSASIGIAVYPDDGVDMENLLKNADVALYQAKDAGRNTFEFFSESLNTSAFHRVVLETSLRSAIDQGSFAVYFQPQVDVADGSLSGVEALLRWTDPRLGPVPPAHFVPLAERVGLIGPLTDLALRRVSAQAAAWALERPELNVSFNLSRQWIRRPDAVDLLRTIVDQAGVEPSMFVLELSESVLVDHAKEAERVLRGLKACGFQLAVDNFGSGYTSLANFRRFPVDYLKIDREFVRGLGTDPQAEGVCAAVINLARSMGVEPVAEGVEDESQRDALLRQGCTLMQGYLFGRPVPASELDLSKAGRPSGALRAPDTGA
ncbi:MAG: putative bifunctional diguanylate cyclase/phosphodiesterase [Gemmatimonadales bacterium]